MRPLISFMIGTDFKINTSRTQGPQVCEMPCSGAVSCPESLSFHTVQPTERAEGSGLHPLGPSRADMSLSKPSQCEHRPQQFESELFQDKHLDYSFFCSWKARDSYISAKHGWHIAQNLIFPAVYINGLTLPRLPAASVWLKDYKGDGNSNHVCFQTEPSLKGPNSCVLIQLARKGNLGGTFTDGPKTSRKGQIASHPQVTHFISFQLWLGGGVGGCQNRIQRLHTSHPHH